MKKLNARTLEMLNIKALGLETLKITIKDLLTKFAPCCICNESDLKNFRIKISIHKGKGSGLRIKCDSCDTDITFEKGMAREPIYPNNIST